jgi:hypothetical protein
MLKPVPDKGLCMSVLERQYSASNPLFMRVGYIVMTQSYQVREDFTAGTARIESGRRFVFAVPSPCSRRNGLEKLAAY